VISYRKVAILLTALFALGAASICQMKIGDAAVDGETTELLYLPNDKLLNHFTAGLSSVVADILWLKTIQYTVAEFHNPERKFTWLNHMVETVTRLDPYYSDVYSRGGMLLAAIGSDESAMKLLHKGAVENPFAPEIPFEMAKIWLLNRYKEPGADTIASHYLRMVAQRDVEHTEFYFRWIRGIQSMQGPGESARAIWEDVLRTAKDDITRELARDNILQLTIEMNVEDLDAMADAYEERFGMRPGGIEDLVSSGILGALPSGPEQGEYMIGADGEIQNTVLLDRATVRLRNYLNRSVETYTADKGHYPRSMDDWSAWADEPIPPHPIEGRHWRYDPKRGTVD